MAVLALACWPGSTSFVPETAANQEHPRRRLLASAVAALPALAAPLRAQAAASPWAGKYSDPQHPGCKRNILVEGRYLTVEGADALQGAECKKTADFNDLKSMLDPAPVKEFTVKGTIKFKKENQATIDFSAKGGPKDLLAVLEEDGGIKFPDGNKWTKIR
eukprot:CAMPEP_0172867754 /NCGR_PEP_ID=MMETSP1075-20121228/84502_1 /TAXON_ID=2916 /ORGANISM="Ceratium fusus, Strain PA161109" /LENGTH=160 /DNA_ID=CAMNT_0013717197 /DNA_START=125 /DNA_END=607 /DNA_ORIENTATION=+